MIEQKALVTQVFHQEIELECALNSTCSGCSNESNCGVGTIAKAFSGKTQLIRVKTSLVLSPGQWVTIATVENNLLAHAFITYFFPLFGLLTAGLVGQWLFVELMLYPETLAIAVAFVGGYLAFLLGKQIIVHLGSNEPSIEITSIDYR